MRRRPPSSMTLLLFLTSSGVSLRSNLPPLHESAKSRLDQEKSGLNTFTHHTSDFGARQNHPSSYQDSPTFLGPIHLLSGASPTMGRERIRHFFQRQELGLSPPAKPLKSSASTKEKLQAIVHHLASCNAPVDVKEVCESVEFVLRTRKRLPGAVQQQQKKQNITDTTTLPTQHHAIYLYDLCCGHGLTGMLFGCCGGGKDDSIKVILVDRKQPAAHKILLERIQEVCPWMTEPHAVTYRETNLESLTSLESYRCDGDEQRLHTMSSGIVISTHACGSLTDRVIELASNYSYIIDGSPSPCAAAIAVMPCCYTGTSRGTPQGIRRALGVAWAADIQRSYYLQSKGYHVDFTAIPREITPMNRILIGEYKASH